RDILTQTHEITRHSETSIESTLTHDRENAPKIMSLGGTPPQKFPKRRSSGNKYYFGVKESPCSRPDGRLRPPQLRHNLSTRTLDRDISIVCGARSRPRPDGKSLK